MSNKTNKDNIFNFIYRMAVDDATSQKAFTQDKAIIASNDETKQCVRKYIDGVLKGDSNPDFMSTDNEIKDILSNVPEFNFGNIQKLINMTAKYMYIACYHDDSLRNNFKECHCPMDGFMIHVVRSEYKKLCNNGKYDRKLLNISLGEGKQSTDGSKITWSKIDFNETNTPNSIEVYNNYQKMVKVLAGAECILPLEYDYKKWKKDE